MERAEEVPRDMVRRKIERGESLSLPEMLMCRIHAMGNGVVLGNRLDIESVPIARKRPTPLAQCDVELFTATRLRGTAFQVA